ncbi:glycogen debranching protein GlgX [Actinotalea sp. M2MS4P-6]|uniref:glycogen debranching protein GlgX n=1 Tax=Actinotalea sp. M2MS4P-6 TaxID=2983762 RepID=UPI0021E50157|nr:glycogen debranching protein GlgX [Actinotalea sp. M2MS4P-6]MCV2394060.1 glycogen debranching protein GlgX [Actinotalea sp. M2MS4P-6]
MRHDDTTHGGLRPLGVHLRADGADVAVLASHATAVDLCLLDPDPTSPDGWTERRVPLTGPSHGVWYAHVPGMTAGQRYGFRAHGRWDPAAGLRYNPAKLLVDPYARGLDGLQRLAAGPAETYGHRVDAEHRPAHDRLDPDRTDSRGVVPHSVAVADPGPAPDTRPRVPWSRTIVYEAHVRGLTRRLSSLPPALRGTYAGLGHPATIEHLTRLGVTTVELLPIQAAATEPWLVRAGRTNYWGYNTLGFFAPHPAYATEAAQRAGADAVLAEVRSAVQALHAAGIEVLLDVVYNHTAEGGTDGPHLSFRGLDPTVYYLHDGGTPARFADVTGCGNSLDFRRPRVVQLALDSLRWWAQQVGVDGYRFDLMVTLGRDADGFTPNHPFLVALQTDPVLSDLKLVAEPWDVGPGGWQTGGFPAPLSEWNDRFRNAVRSFWLGDPAAAAHGRPGHGVRELATRLAGSADLFGYSDPPLMRGVVASINYITAHDGFTLADLVAYDHKHNLDNGEQNRDGSDDNRSWNHGIEGPLDAAGPGLEILPLRRRSMRNLLGTLLLSAGVPMITAGDEIGRTQRGNNNAYNQDNAMSWLDWELSPWRQNVLATAAHLVALRQELPALHQAAFFRGVPHDDCADPRPDLFWRTADGHELRTDQWHDPAVRTLQMIRTACDGSAVLVVINGSLDETEVVAADGTDGVWRLRWDSAAEHPDELDPVAAGRAVLPGDTIPMDPLTMRVYASAPE